MELAAWCPLIFRKASNYIHRTIFNSRLSNKNTPLGACVGILTDIAVLAILGVRAGHFASCFVRKGPTALAPEKLNIRSWCYWVTRKKQAIIESGVLFKSKSWTCGVLFCHLHWFIFRCASVVSTGQLEGKHGHDRLTTGTWNPHQNCQQFASANEHQVNLSWILATLLS